MFTYAFASCFIAWFPIIVPVGFLLAEVRPPTVCTRSVWKSTGAAIRGFLLSLNNTTNNNITLARLSKIIGFKLI